METKMKLFGIRFILFGEKEMSMSMTQRTSSPQLSTDMERLWFGAVFLLRLQDEFTALRNSFYQITEDGSWMVLPA